MEIQKLDGLNLNQISTVINNDNRAKGFWDKERNLGEMLMLVVTELAEGMECARKNNFCREVVNTEHFAKMDEETFKSDFKESVKDTFEDEIADTMIRLFDLCGGLGIDIQSHIELKLTYNKTRPKLHGKQF